MNDDAASGGSGPLARDIMTAEVVSATPDTPLARVAETMIRRRLRALPVISERREVLGIVTEREVMEHFLPRFGRPNGRTSEGDRAGRVPVREVMRRSVLCVKEDQPLREVAALMLNKDAERFPVCSEGTLVGFLTRGDVVRELLARPAGAGRTEHGARRRTEDGEAER